MYSYIFVIMWAILKWKWVYINEGCLHSQLMKIGKSWACKASENHHPTKCKITPFSQVVSAEISLWHDSFNYVFGEYTFLPFCDWLLHIKSIIHTWSFDKNRVNIFIIFLILHKFKNNNIPLYVKSSAESDDVLRFSFGCLV